MSTTKPQFHAYNGMGKFALGEIHMNQTVRIGNILKISGQGAWDPKATSFGTMNIPDDVEAQTDQVFANVEHALKDAGGKGWSQVYSVRSLHVGLDDRVTAAMSRNFRRYCPGEPPIWTQVGVAALGIAAMKVEIEVEAFDG
ncbi:hypothetical protein LTR10_011297 [Elasticomyces elasticus]|nr:hypothetical protein LTR10_011297 [Elasticomyces elasticus]KAK4966288.1 hypothetical protein LTR42_011449 [Elasticomyces elasticus]